MYTHEAWNVCIMLYLQQLEQRGSCVVLKILKLFAKLQHFNSLNTIDSNRYLENVEMQIVETTSCSANLFTIAQAHWLVSGVFQEKQYSL